MSDAQSWTLIALVAVLAFCALVPLILRR